VGSEYGCWGYGELNMLRYSSGLGTIHVYLVGDWFKKSEERICLGWYGDGKEVWMTWGW
jgi:hypothetical protein